MEFSARKIFVEEEDEGGEHQENDPRLNKHKNKSILNNGSVDNGHKTPIFIMQVDGQPLRGANETGASVPSVWARQAGDLAASDAERDVSLCLLIMKMASVNRPVWTTKPMFSRLPGHVPRDILRGLHAIPMNEPNNIFTIRVVNSRGSVHVNGDIRGRAIERIQV